LTNNTRRDDIADDPGEVAANPRLENEWGHIVEITEHGDDSGALSFHWEIFMLCGDPAQQGGITNLADLAKDAGDNIPGIPDATYFAGFDPAKVSPIAAPDNFVLDDEGNLWVATDGQPGKPFFGQNDGVFAVPTEGPDRGYLRQFLSGIPGGEVCGPEFSSDYRTFFCGIQHPGEDGGLMPNSISNWPEGEKSPPKPSVVSVWNQRGGRIGEGLGDRRPPWNRKDD
jgi:secreted PhoX family phosphatase